MTLLPGNLMDICNQSLLRNVNDDRVTSCKIGAFPVDRLSRAQRTELILPFYGYCKKMMVYLRRLV